MPLFRFPDDPEWDEAADAVVLRVLLGEYDGRVVITRRVIQGVVGHRPKPEEAVELVHANRLLFERAAERRITDRGSIPTATSTSPAAICGRAAADAEGGIRVAGCGSRLREVRRTC